MGLYRHSGKEMGTTISSLSSVGSFSRINVPLLLDPKNIAPITSHVSEASRLCALDPVEGLDPNPIVTFKKIEYGFGYIITRSPIPHILST